MDIIAQGEGVSKEEVAKLYSKEYYQRNKTKIKRHVLSKTYEKLGMTIADKKKMYKAQGRLCQICKKKIPLYKSHLDHCHLTNKVRGILCHKCNTGIGLLGDSLEIVLSAALYLGTNNQFDILTRSPKMIS